MENEINKAHEEGESAPAEAPQERKIVVPGEVIVSGEDYLPGEGTRKEGQDIRASRYGMAQEFGKVTKVIPLSGAFIPQRNNIVIGTVVDIAFSGWLINIGYASTAFLSLEEFPRYVNKNEMDQHLGIGDIVAAKIWSVKAKGIDLSMKGPGLGKLDGGFTFKVIPSRVPRIIGREGSMISLIKERTNCKLTVGQNGEIWIKGEKIDDEIKARKAVEYVADKVAVSGLTQKMEDWFAENDK
ncbi:RNA-binding protein [Candidatus Pacearchaeota archaeon]|nr:RNA-binding protein [Candidatus Pacearchaeota archaeon]